MSLSNKNILLLADSNAESPSATNRTFHRSSWEALILCYISQKVKLHFFLVRSITLTDCKVIKAVVREPPGI